MTFSKKKSRPITVDEKDYRFQISISKTDVDGHYRLNVSAQIASGDGSVLQAVGLVTRDFWIDAPDLPPAESWQSAYPAVTPKHIAILIKKGLEAGWQPDAAGPPCEFNIDNVSLFAK